MRVLMTGATAGIGLETANRLLADEFCVLVVGARAPQSAPAILKEKATLREVDLANLASVRAFAAAVAKDGPFDALVLNAGLQCVNRRTSADRFELTFAVNHLAHYLLARLLLPSLAPGGRIVITSSGTHDPELNSGLPPPRHADAGMLARPDTDPERDEKPMTAGRRAYCSSKLANAMTARELAARLAASRPDVAVIAFDPGFTPGTGLARDYPGPVGLIFKYIMPLITRGPHVNTLANVGGRLADLVRSPDFAGARGEYYRVRGTALERKEPSTLARDPAACAKLWDDSAALVGLAA
jgi:protochlorophyllide reductase